jgi:hypothetical protein
VGKRSRQRKRLAAPGEASTPQAPTSDFSDADGNVLTLRGSLTARARRGYAQTLAGTAGGGARPAATREDTEQRALELLFERLAVRWVIAGAPIERQRELLTRFRVASTQERAFVRRVLREHCGEWFPELEVP